MIERGRRLICGIRGHAVVFCFEKQRLSLRCLNCDFRTAGWNIEPGRDSIGVSIAQRATQQAIGDVPR